MPEPVSAADTPESLGRGGMVTVWDAEGRYLGCMGIASWRSLLLENTPPPADTRRCRAPFCSCASETCPEGDPVVSPAEPPEEVAAERDELRRVLYEAAREVPTSDAGVHKHHDLQHLHRRIIAALREEEPDGEWVTYDYWIGRYP